MTFAEFCVYAMELRKSGVGRILVKSGDGPSRNEFLVEWDVPGGNGKELESAIGFGVGGNAPQDDEEGDEEEDKNKP